MVVLQHWALEELKTLERFSRSKPSFWPSAMASHTPAIVMPRTRLLQSLVDWPAPVDPQCTACFPITGTSVSSTRANDSGEFAPTMKVSVAPAAPGTPPLTGASTNSSWLPASAPASLFLPSSTPWSITEHSGPVEEQSMKNSGCRSSAGTDRSPWSPRKTLSTIFALGSMLMTVLSPGTRASSAGVLATRTPSRSNCCSAASLVSHTTTFAPLSTKFRHMGMPMAPTPTKPIGD
mmetsp:Transcript_358/g.831  ORF Transcript_358/g.831 Transcript_358/m.831 type:complete len:235 (+) Transcript_358:325-1029(+)